MQVAISSANALKRMPGALSAGAADSWFAGIPASEHEGPRREKAGKRDDITGSHWLIEASPKIRFSWRIGGGICARKQLKREFCVAV
ncbi:hypothetical protein [Cupriavidus pauculus]|uniref:hypothetical protein n=1 Tax=Cupriavidus pauculus TaxID=82633 RepID=UPI0014797155|nr:hypothetical protein [Cupriavidus pauculus]UAL00667.1 hypothetical protein K8O84_04745 [Cupriavidus pauculus]